MKQKAKFSGSWRHRILVVSLSILMGILIYQLLGFILDDISHITGPNYKHYKEQYVSQKLEHQIKSNRDLQLQVRRHLNRLQEKQQLLQNSITGYHKTLQQILNIQQANLKGGSSINSITHQSLTKTIAFFLSDQRNYQQVNQAIIHNKDQEQQLKDQERTLVKAVAAQTKPALTAYQNALLKHNILIASYQLSLVLPLLIISLIVTYFYRSLYRPLLHAISIALIVRSVLVLYRYFPAIYFKYIVASILLIIIIIALVKVIQRTIKPQSEWLIKQYRENYKKLLCPQCQYPIAPGPLKLFNNKRLTSLTLDKSMWNVDVATGSYFCPACGIGVYRICQPCQKVRHAQLPYCEHCGDKTNNL